MRAVQLTLAMLICAVLVVLAPIPALAENGAISGRITSPDGVTPIAHVSVISSRHEGDLVYLWHGTQTGADGRYRLELEPGTYSIYFLDEAGYYLSEYYDDVRFPNQPTLLTLSANEEIGGIDASLALAGHIQGRVTGAHDGSPLANIRATADLVGVPGLATGGSDLTDTAGHYDIGGLDTGTYVVKFYSTDQPYLSEYYDDVPNESTATRIAVVAGETVTGIDAALGLGAAIQGVITDADSGQPLSAAAVILWYRPESGVWEQAGQSTTNVYGMYAFPGLRPGVYRLGVFYGGWPPTYYDNASTLETATDIVLATGTVHKRDFAIASTGPAAPPAEIPEPATLLMVGTGLAALALGLLKKRQRPG